MGVVASSSQARTDSIGFTETANSSHCGFLPVPISRVPLAALRDMAVYLRTGSTSEKDAFTLFCGASIEFSQKHLDRLASSGITFIYIPIAQQALFQQQTEEALLKVANDSSTAASVRSEIIYETSVQLVNELLSEPDLAGKSKRLNEVSRA